MSSLEKELSSYVGHLKEMNDISRGYLENFDYEKEIVSRTKVGIESRELVIKGLEKILEKEKKQDDEIREKYEGYKAGAIRLCVPYVDFERYKFEYLEKQRKRGN